MKISRLLEMTILLLNRGTVTAAELSKRFEVSKRTIYRDIDVLSSSGIPVYTNKGKRGGISLLENYSLSKTMLSDRESDSLLLALKTLEAIKYPEIDGVLNKVGAIFKNAAASDWVQIEFTPWGSGPNEDNRFLNIKKAILGSKVISFDYVNSGGGRSRRTIEPMKLIYKGQAWYLWGYCRLREEFRVFRISRIKNLSISDQTFKRRPVEKTEGMPKSVPEARLIEIKLKFQPEATYRLYDDFDDEMIKRNEDGTCCVTVTADDADWLYGYIMSYGCYAEVLEPEHIRNKIKERLRTALSFYK